MKTYIYILQDPVTFEVRYVGKSKNPHRRYLSHLWQKPKVKYHSYYWIQKLLKSGVRPIMAVIDETDGEWEWLEKYWIGQCKQWGFNLTNITAGGEGGEGSENHWNRKVVSCYTVNGCFIKTYNSIKEAALDLGIARGHLIGALKGRALLCKGMQWRYGNSMQAIDDILVYGKMTKHLKIEQYSKDGVLLDEFTSIKELSKKLNLQHSANIYQCINNKRKTAYGYKWKLHTEPIL